MWRIDEVEGRDFRGYKELSAKIRSRGITLIIGKRQNHGRSNGAGKSTLFALIMWVLYGVMPKNPDKVEKVIRRGADKAYGRIKITDEQGTVTIERTRTARDSALAITGFDDRATKRGQQAAIDARFGNAQNFLSTSMFSGAVSSFCKLTDAQRKDLLDELIGVAEYSKASDLAKRLADAVQVELSVQRASIEAQEERVERAENDCAAIAQATFMHPLIVSREYDRLVKEACEANEVVVEAGAALSTCILGELRERARIEQEKVTALKVVETHTAALKAADTAVNELTVKDSIISAKIRDLTDDINSISSGKHADTCPTCGQRWAQDKDPEVVAQAVESRQKQIQTLRAERAPITKALLEAKGTAADVTQLLSAARKAFSKIEAGSDGARYSELLSVMVEAETDLRHAHEAVAEFARTHDLDATTDDIAEASALVDDAREKMRELVAVKTEKEELLARLAFWRKGFSKTGLPSYLIDANIPRMNKVAQEIADDLTDGELTVTLNPAATKGSKSVFAVEVDFAEGGDGYDAASNGEETRVDMCVLFAIRDLVANNGGRECQQLFIDEMFDGADEHFVDACIKMLRKRYGDRGIYLISHEPGASSLCDHIMCAKKVKGISSLT